MKEWMQKISLFFNNKKFKYGGYSIVLTVIVIALILLVNFGFSMLDGYYDLKIDYSQNQTYSVSVQSQNVLQNLDEDIIIYTLYSVNSDDPTIREILSKYKSYSDHVQVINKDPNQNPTFVNQFDTDNTGISEGYIIVTNADNSKFKVLDTYDQYEVSYDSSGTPSVDQIIVEGSVTNAIRYITADKIQKVYFLQGQGEPTAYDSSYMRDSLTDMNCDVEDYNILTSDVQLQSGDIVVVLSPTTDISDDERNVLKDHINQGGRFLFAFNPQVGRLDNFGSLLELYGVKLADGLVVEGDRNYYASGNPFYLIPSMSTHDITSTIKSNNVPLIIAFSGAVVAPDEAPATNITIQSLLSTSSSAWLESDLTKVDVTKDEGAQTGPFSLGLAVTKTDSENSENDVRFLVFNNPEFIMYAETSNYASFANSDFSKSCIKWLSDAIEDVYVRGKVTDNPVLYFSSAKQVYTVIILVWPVLSLLLFAGGIVVYLKRKNL